ncbi:hypothetical protein C0995_006301 [Termitomyces sp. Mi166|nr:hypothetical protein C0995_006301 [Termitomyces sp. Mi166\
MGIDYATVAAGENTPLLGEYLIVDDSDPSVIFEGNWASNTGLISKGMNSIRAYGNSTRQTSSLGTSVFVYGVNIIQDSGFGGSQLTINHTLDGITTQSVYPADSSLYGSNNFEWFNAQGLSPINHTLTMAVTTPVFGAIFSLDYIIYAPSFASLPPPTHSTNFPPPPTHTSDFPSPPAQPGISRGVLLGVTIGPVIFGLLACRLVDTASAAYEERKLYVAPSGFQFTTLNLRAVEPFPLTESEPRSSDRPMVQRKPPLPVGGSYALQRRASQHSDTGSANETIVVDPEVQELRELVVSLQQEIEETRQVSGAQNGALMRDIVRNQAERLPNEHRRNEDHMASV